jgi:hypothetical protein
VILLEVVHPLNIYQYTPFYGPKLTGENLHPSQMYVSHFRMDEATELKIMVSRSPSMAFLLNFVKIYQFVKKLIGERHTDMKVIT